jgi:hypothetical protein
VVGAGVGVVAPGAGVAAVGCPVVIPVTGGTTAVSVAVVAVGTVAAGGGTTAVSAGVVTAGGAAAASDAVAPHALPVGTGLPCALHASGYVHPPTAVLYCAVSWVSNHPSGVLTLSFAVNVGGGSVSGARVAVYDGMSDTCPAGTPARLVGGNAPNWDVDDGTIVPAPGPPVIHGWNVPLNWGVLTPMAAQVPRALRGSGGIHPPSRPS